MRQLKIGFIGAGRIADMHYGGYRDNPKARLYALCDSNTELLEKRSREWNIDRKYTNYHELINDPDIDAVEIITPHHLHAEMSIAALEAGKHVSVQKPMSLNIAEANDVVSASKQTNRVFRVIENYRFAQPVVTAKNMIESDEIGEPISIRIKSLTGNVNFGWEVPSNAQDWRSDASKSGEGSILFDHGQHIWSIARFFMGDIDSTFAFVGKQTVQNHHELPPGSLLDNPAMVNWKYTEGTRYGSWETVYADDMVIKSKYYPIYVTIEITGTKGVLWINNFIGEKLDRPPLEMYRNGEITRFNNIDIDYSNSFALAVHDFIDAILEDRNSDMTGMEAREVLRFSMAALLSGRENRLVYLDEITD